MTWISKDGAEYHYYTHHSSICRLSDILRNTAYTHNTADNPNVKCPICKGLLKSKQVFKISLEKFRKEAKEVKFLQKYKESPTGFLLHYMNSPENLTLTLKKIRHDLSREIDGIDVEDILSEALVHGDIICKDEKFYPVISGAIPL